jgi:hypothetical protein
MDTIGVFMSAGHENQAKVLAYCNARHDFSGTKTGQDVFFWLQKPDAARGNIEHKTVMAFAPV